MELKRVIDNVYWLVNGKRTLASLNMCRGRTVYGEKTFHINGEEFREWIPSRSKLAAAFYNGLRDLDLKKGYSVLYLGASSGTTVSHVSDVVGREGAVYAVEISEEMGSHLILLAENRKNVYPIIADANKVGEYIKNVPKCDFLYQDVAQRNQVEIFVKNAADLLKPGKFGALCVKTRSIDVSASKSEIIAETRRQLGKAFNVVASFDLYPYQKDHELILVKKLTGQPVADRAKKR